MEYNEKLRLIYEEISNEWMGDMNRKYGKTSDLPLEHYLELYSSSLIPEDYEYGQRIITDYEARRQ